MAVGRRARVYPGCPIPRSSRTTGPSSCATVRTSPTCVIGTAPPTCRVSRRLRRECGGSEPAWSWIRGVMGRRYPSGRRRAGDGRRGCDRYAVAPADVADPHQRVAADGQFRQLTDDPSYVTDNSATSAARCAVDRFFFSRPLGLSIPVTFQRNLGHQRSLLSQRHRPARRRPAAPPHARNERRDYAFSPGESAGDRHRALVARTRSRCSDRTRRDTRTSLLARERLEYAFTSTTMAPNASVVRFGGKVLRLNPSRIHSQRGGGTDAERFTFLVPIQSARRHRASAVSQTRAWQNSGGCAVLTPWRACSSASMPSPLAISAITATRPRWPADPQHTCVVVGNDSVWKRSAGTTSLSLTSRVGTWIRPRASAGRRSRSRAIRMPPAATSGGRYRGTVPGAAA